MKFLLLNGPPRAGKDTAADAILAALNPYGFNPFAAKFGMSYHLKEATHALYGHPGRPHDYYEACKDDPHPDFFGLTPREAYIAVSEKLLKPLHGKAVFGKFFVRRVSGLGAGIVVAPDAGFADEWAPVADEFGEENMLLLRVHAEGRGKSFKGDSRSFIHIPGVAAFDVDNNGGEAEFCARLVRIAKRWAE